ncbi:zinc-binding dehydrogenase [Caldithrix abyssi]
MKAIRIHEHGSADVLRVEELPIPEIESDEVLIRVEAAALNHLDLWVRKGIPGVPLPLIMGSEAAGEVVRVGERAHNRFGLNVGDHVFNIPIHSCGRCPYCLAGKENLCARFQIPGESMQGVQAEYIAVPAAYVYRRPENLSWAETAAFPLAGMTAYHMLVQKAGVRPEHTVLVYGASSGVGSSAIQIARAFGARVITTVGSAQKAELAKKLGADYVIRYDQESIGQTVKELTDGQGADIIIEHPGQATWRESLRALKKGGKLVTCGATTGPKVEIDLRALFIKHQQIIGSTMGTRKDIIELADLIRRGKFKPQIAREFTFEEAAKAHAFLESGQAFGKVVLINR